MCLTKRTVFKTILPMTTQDLAQFTIDESVVFEWWKIDLGMQIGFCLWILFACWCFRNMIICHYTKHEIVLCNISRVDTKISLFWLIVAITACVMPIVNSLFISLCT